MTKVRFPPIAFLFACSVPWLIHGLLNSKNPPPPLVLVGIIFLFTVFGSTMLWFSIFPMWAFDEKGIYRYGFHPGVPNATFRWDQVLKFWVKESTSRGQTFHTYALFMDDPKAAKFEFIWIFRADRKILAEVVRLARAAKPDVEIDPRILTKIDAPFFTQADFFDLGLNLFVVTFLLCLFFFYHGHGQEVADTRWSRWFLWVLAALDLWLLFLMAYKYKHRLDHGGIPKTPYPPNLSIWGISLLRNPGPIFATYFLLTLLVGVYTCELVYALDKVRLDTPGSWTLIAFGASGRDLVLGNGEWYRLFNSTLLHVNFHHLAYNCFALYLVGYALEDMVGHRWFFTIFFLAGLGGSLASLAFSPAHTISLGASGAIMGLMGAALVVSFKLPKGAARSWIHWYIGPAFVLSLLPLADKGERIDLWGHAGGAVVGAVLGLLLFDLWNKEEPLPAMKGLAGALALVSLGVFTWAAYIPVQAYATNREVASKLVPEKELPPVFEKAVERSKELATKYPHDPRALHYRAHAYLKVGNGEAAKKLLKAALAEKEVLRRLYQPGLEDDLRIDLADILVGQGRRQEALEVAKPLCEGDHDDRTSKALERMKLCN